MSTHEQIHESLDAYLAGGLTPAERKDVEIHIESCAECAQTVKDARQLEQTMTKVFAMDRPDAALEERAIAKLRTTRIRRATALRFIGAAAAVLLFGIVGAALQALAFSDAMKPTGRSVAQNEMREMPRGLRMWDDTRSMAAKESAFDVVDVNPNLFDVDADIQYKADRVGEVSVPGSVNRNEAGGIREGKEEHRVPILPAIPAESTRRGAGRSLSLIDADQGALAKLGQTGGMPDPNDLFNLRLRPGEAKEGLGSAKLTPIKMFADRIDNLDDVTKKEAFAGEIADKRPPIALRSPYFKPADPAMTEPAKTPPPESRVPIAPPIPPKDGPPVNSPTTGEKDKEGSGPPKGVNPPEQPEPMDRKIIRTGDIEFEIDSFDKAAATVKRLIGAVKGGFISTRNSDQLPNGKMKGSIIVRMPPEHLDDFILGLRAELTKVGTLRSERVGSQDVTKQYTDTESELKAARVVADRLIEIIKTPKAEVKDLIAAERELGNWRTKIEKMEGEIRYYKNQIALSTLTITLYEKEIQAPSALVITDQIKMRIEVENVPDAHKAALKALDDVKGRITKSELKQHKAGQLEAILHAEVPPAQKDAFRNQLAKLGIVLENEETQKQQAEGGTGKAPGLKPQVSDVQFEVALNDIANVQPRQSVTLVVATLDVPGHFAKLKDAIVRVAKGQIRDAQISEKDKQNVSAVIEFNVPIDQKVALDKLIGEAGPVLARSASQVAVTEMATERKYGYKLYLESASNVAPREKIALRIEVADVERKLTELKEKVKNARGRVLDEKSGLQPNGQAGAKLVFEVPLAAADGLVAQFKESGSKVSFDTQRNLQVPDNDLASAQITVVLAGVDPLVASDASYLRRGLSWSFTVFAWCVVAIITGLGAIVPVGIVLFVMYWLIRKIWPTSAVKAAPATSP
jgi:hypothetical protein